MYSLRCRSCGNKVEKVYKFVYENSYFGCEECVIEKYASNPSKCPHCEAEIDEFTRVYYKDDSRIGKKKYLVGCENCVAFVDGYKYEVLDDEE